MADVVIDNPVLNSLYAAPARHFKFDSDGITNEVVEGRRRSEFFVPVPQTRKRGTQLEFENTWTSERLKPNDLVNQVRGLVDLWRTRKYPHVSPITRQLLEYWSDPSRDNPIMFCQREAAETAIYLTEASRKDGHGGILDLLEETNLEFNAGLPRVAMKMATGTGKTVVMCMLIAWMTLNKVANPNDSKYCKRFLVVTPGVTIRDRLRVIQPGTPGNYYAARGLVPPGLVDQLGQAQIEITNYHVFLPRVTREAEGIAATTRALLLGDRPEGAPNPFEEAPEMVAARVSRAFGLGRGEIVVINDEAHHCYMEKPAEPVVEDLDADAKAEAQEEAVKARVWFRGIQGLQKRLGIKSVYDLSATPFYLAGSGYGEGVLFSWVVSDFSLVDAIESGIVKVPRLPIDDNAEVPAVVFRNLWDQVRDELPKRSKQQVKSRSHDPQLPAELELALRTLYDNYEKAFQAWAESGDRNAQIPPVFIVVCNNTTVSKLVFDWIAGYDRDTVDLEGQPVQTVAAGNLPLFSNVKDGKWLAMPQTILVDSQQLESGGQLDDSFKAAARREIQEFTTEYLRRHPGRSADDIDEADLLREVMNTIGKQGMLGEQVRCVVSVSMLTEGWDANTVSHVLGVRAFRTPLLTEQVVGRGLRRRNYEVDPATGLLPPEYAEIFGVPFAFIPASGGTKDPVARRAPVNVKAIAAQEAARITFPRLLGYRLDMPDPTLSADFTNRLCEMRLTNAELPTEVHVADVLGHPEAVYPTYLEGLREQEVSFHLAKRLIEREYRAPDEQPRPWLFPSVLRLVRDWMRTALTYEGQTYPGLLLIGDLREKAVERIVKGIVEDPVERRERLLPVFDHTQPEGSSDYVDFLTTREAEPADASRCHVNYVTIDSGWERTVAKAIEAMPEVAAYVKNDGLDFWIPYMHEGMAARYKPDFLIRLVDQPDGLTRTLIVEVSGGLKKVKQPGDVKEKADTVRGLWLPAINGHGGYGMWDYLEVHDPSTAPAAIRSAAQALLARTREVAA